MLDEYQIGQQINCLFEHHILHSADSHKQTKRPESNPVEKFWSTTLNVDQNVFIKMCLINTAVYFYCCLFIYELL